MAEEFKVGQKVRLKTYTWSSQIAGTIEHITDNMALVHYGLNNNKLVKLSELVSAEPPKPEPIKPGWYSLNGRHGNFIYYCEQRGEQIIYYMACNPKTGEMDFDPLFPVAVAKTLIGAVPGQLTRMKFTAE